MLVGQIEAGITDALRLLRFDALGPSDTPEAGTSKAERSVLVVVTVTTSSSMTGWSARGSSAPVAEIDHIKTGKATLLDT